jgi:hypothetical protein
MDGPEVQPCPLGLCGLTVCSFPLRLLDTSFLTEPPLRAFATGGLLGIRRHPPAWMAGQDADVY